MQLPKVFARARWVVDVITFWPQSQVVQASVSAAALEHCP